MKYEHQIRTGDFEYIQESGEYETPEDAVAAHISLKRAWSGGEGIGAKEFAEIVYTYCSEGFLENGGEWYENASNGQRSFLNELKKVVRSRK